LPRLETNEIITDKIMSNATSNNEEQSEIELSESDLQLQVRKMNILLSYYTFI